LIQILKDFSQKATNNKNRRIMKKTYIKPEMELVEEDMYQPLLTESLPMDDTEVDTGDILAPDMTLFVIWSD
jgi:hypothetical protein